MSDTQGPVFIAHNRDGMGERLRALINAMVCAERLGGTFKFSWPRIPESLQSAHSVIEARAFFLSDFVDAHYIDHDALKDLQITPLGQAQDALAKGDTIEGMISVAQPRLDIQAPKLFRFDDLTDALPSQFEQIGFNTEIKEARDAARRLDLPEAVAIIHLRAGDVIYGMYRTMDDFHGKVLSYPIAIAIIEALKADGVTPILMGQDAELLTYLKEQYGVLNANELGDRSHFSTTQHAFFDVCLLGRASRIIAGSSGFAVLGAWLAGIKVQSPNSIFSPQQSFDIIENHVLNGSASQAISGHQRAFAARSAFVLTGRTLPTDARYWALLEAARDNDPDNDFIQLVYACSLYTVGKADQAEEILQYLFHKTPPERGRFLALMKNVNARTGLRIGPYLSILEAQAETGRAMAALCCAISHHALGALEDGARFHALYEQHASDDMRNFPGRILPEGAFASPASP